MSEKRLRVIFFSLVTLFTWLMYFKTTAPTVVFWDVGEFLATSYILGIPHPPGTPLYVILGKFMTLLPLPMASLFKLLSGGEPVEPVLRITLISITSGAFTAGFVYLITVKVIEKWNIAKKYQKEIPAILPHLAGIVGALLGAFARTVWMNSIEAETYTPSVFTIALVVWVILNWWENIKDPKSIRYILFALYVAFLSSGIHLMALIILPVVFVFVLIMHPKLILDWEFLAVTAATFLLIALSQLTYKPLAGEGLGGSIVLGLLSAAVLVGYYFMQVKDPFGSTKKLIASILVIFGILAFLYGLSVIKRGAALGVVIGTLSMLLGVYVGADLYKNWKGFALILIVIAFSVEFFMIVRAIHNPSINEAWPSNWKAFMDVLLRKQYEPAKIFPRKIALIDQIKVYLLYFSWQYASLWVPMLALGIVGFVISAIEDWKTWILVGGALIIGSVGLFIYLNLKDSPTHPVNPANLARGMTEVRDRDYFYAPAFTFNALFAGLALYEIGIWIYEAIKSKATTYLGVLLGFVMFGAQVSHFYPIVDRSQNYIAEDYAYNMLISPAKGAVMYTNGDNDTFPLWFDQEVLGVRKDVIIANLSLLNTNWYVKQLKLKGAPISFTPEQIDKLPPVLYPAQTSTGYLMLADFMIRDMIATSLGYKTDDVLELPNGLKFPRIYLASQKEFLDSVIAKGGKFSTPIYFAITVSRDHMSGWEQYLEMEGMAMGLRTHKVSDSPGYEGLNVEKTRHLLHGDMRPQEFVEKYGNTKPPWPDVFRYRGVFNPRVYKDGTHEKLIRNYASVALRLASEYQQRAINVASINPALKDSFVRLALDEFWFGQKFISTLSEETRKKLEGNITYINLTMAQLYAEIGEYDSALALMKPALQSTTLPDNQKLQLYYQIANIYLTMGDTTQATQYLQMIVDRLPQEKEVHNQLARLYLKQGDTARALEILKEANQYGNVAPDLKPLLPPAETVSTIQTPGNQNITIGGK